MCKCRWCLLVEEVPQLAHPVHPGGEEEGEPGGGPGARRQPRHARPHPHDGAVLQVLAPDLARVPRHRQEVLGIERVPVNCDQPDQWNTLESYKKKWSYACCGSSAGRWR